MDEWRERKKEKRRNNFDPQGDVCTSNLAIQVLLGGILSDL